MINCVIDLITGSYEDMIYLNHFNEKNGRVIIIMLNWINHIVHLISRFLILDFKVTISF